MRLGLTLGYSGAAVRVDLELVREAERLGFDSVWSAEAYGSDAVVPLAWIAAQTQRIRLGTAILQVAARTPAATAMTAMTLDALSGGRFILGLGPSGAQVVEGWHGVPYGKPLTRMREYVAVIREILRREKPVEFHGEYYQLPNTGPGTTGQGKPLKSIIHPRADLEIYTAAISPNGLRLAAEIAEGVLPIWLSPERFDVLRRPLEEGFRRAGGAKSLDRFDVAPAVTCVLGSDVQRCRDAVKPQIALYVGGMGSRDRNFYNDYVARLGYEEAARRIQTLYLDGKRAEATAAVPDALVDEIALCGPAERIAERLDAWKAAPIGTLLLATAQREVLRVVAERVL